MTFLETEISGVYIIETQTHTDERGVFVKIFHKGEFKNKKLNINFRESFYSISKKNVIRGMHFHLPPKDHSKLIYVTNGAILDVVLDLRNGSPTYGKYISRELSEMNNRMIFIPRGCAHGFLSLKDNTCTVYLQSSTYSKEHDTGICYDSFNMDWKTKNPIVSDRDKKFIALEDFISPFNYREKK